MSNDNTVTHNDVQTGRNCKATAQFFNHNFQPLNLNNVKEIIKELRDYSLNIDAPDGDFNVSKSEALQIADALEVATFPPIVKVALSVLQNLNETNRGMAYIWATIDKDQDLRLSSNEPVFDEQESEWSIDSGQIYININIGMQNFHFNTKDMLFRRTANGWEWYGNPDKTTETP